MNKIGIITVSYNSGLVIEEFLDSLLRQSYSDWQLYIVDSASHDDTLTKIANYVEARITILPQSKNVGFASGNNIGVAKAIADGCNELLLINNDTIFAPDFLDKFCNLRKQYPHAILTPKIYYPDNLTLWCAGGGFRPERAYAAYHRGENEIDNGQYDSNDYCDFVPMCCVMIPLQSWYKVGELDEKFFIYSEDADWFYRAHKLDIKLMYCFGLSLIHKVSSLTGGAKSKIGAWYGSRNRVYFLRKHFSGWQCSRLLATYCGGMLIKLILRKYSIKEFYWRLSGVINGFRL